MTQSVLTSYRDELLQLMAEANSLTDLESVLELWDASKSDPSVDSSYIADNNFLIGAMRLRIIQIKNKNK